MYTCIENARKDIQETVKLLHPWSGTQGLREFLKFI